MSTFSIAIVDARLVSPSESYCVVLLAPSAVVTERQTTVLGLRDGTVGPVVAEIAPPILCCIWKAF